MRPVSSDRRGYLAEILSSQIDTKVVSPAIQLPVTMRPPGFLTTRTNSLATSSANMAPKTVTIRSKLLFGTPARLQASPSWKWILGVPGDVQGRSCG